MRFNFLKNLIGTGDADRIAPAQGDRTVRVKYSIATVYDLHGNARRLGSLYAKGGEGSIYPLVENNKCLVKAYHTDNRSLQGLENLRKEKISFMLGMQNLVDDPRYAWPRLNVFDDSRRWIGYAMRKVDGHMLQTLCQPQLLSERFPDWKRQNLVKTCINLILGIEKLHKNNVILGDINPANMLVDNSSRISFIDCDSYQVKSLGKIYTCPVCIPMYLAPELINAGNLSTITRTEEQELFSVAIILFKILMIGRHPYDRIGGADPVENLKSGRLAFGYDCGERFSKGPWHRIWSHLPYKMKNLFIQTFKDGHKDVSKRVNLGDWLACLSIYENEIEKGWHENEIIPSKAKESKHYKEIAA
jgi:DNA-binding helix-hairpin-helix protein with protein kinase domain